MARAGIIRSHRPAPIQTNCVVASRRVGQPAIPSGRDLLREASEAAGGRHDDWADDSGLHARIEHRELKKGGFDCLDGMR